MANILLIETSTEVCSVGISVNGQLVSLKEKRDQKSHATKIALFIDEILRESSIRPQSLDAVAVSSGPGSYTGLRIGVSTAKGICYALGIPLIAIDTLQSLAQSFADEHHGMIGKNDILIPMIDARRMEVYAAYFDSNGNRICPTEAIVLKENSFNDRTSAKIWLLGDGAAKTTNLFAHREDLNIINDYLPSAKHLTNQASQAFKKKEFADIAYFEPHYLKDFVAAVPQVKGLK